MIKNYPRIIEAVGLNIRTARLKAKLTQSQLAEISKVSRNQIVKVELGKVQASTVTMDMICTALNVDILKILEPYVNEAYVYKNTAQSRSPKRALLRVSESQKPQDTQEKNNFQTMGLAGGDKSGKMKAMLIILRKFSKLYKSDLVMMRQLMYDAL